MSRLLKVGVQLPEVERPVRWPELRDIAVAAEAVGFDSLWVGDNPEAVNLFEAGCSSIHWVGVSSSGLLIHAVCGSGGGVGGLRTNRSGWVW